MHLGFLQLGVLAVVATGEDIIRETLLPGAIVTRTADSHLRVGTFQYAANWGSGEELRNLADYTIERHYPNLEQGENRYLAFLKAVIKRQASLIAKWQLVGFIHGVMNTDNMTISGETIDYGPCAFMDTYDPKTVFSSIDRQGRYAYGNQPYIGGWNLARLAEALLPLLHDNEKQAIEIAEGALADYNDQFQSYWLAGMRAKLGLLNEEKEDETLIADLLKMMEAYQADYTNTFRALTFENYENIALFQSKEFIDWHKQWKARQERQEKSGELSQQIMRSSNPAVIPRNHRVEEALKAAVEEGDYSVMEKLLRVLEKPFAHTPDQEEYCKLPEPSKIPYRTFCGT